MDPLVSVEWLAARLREPDVAVLDATLPPVGVVPAPDTRARYLEQHIPGAVFFDIEEVSDHNTPLPHMLPSGDEFAEHMRSLGIGDEMTIVVYEQEALFSAARAWWMLRTMGAMQVYVLDGGLRAWIAANQPTEAGAVERTPALFFPKRDSAAIRNFAEVQQLLATHGQILDARSASRFDGSAPEPRPGLLSGHMPGAVSLPYTDVLAEGRMKPAQALGELFASRGVDLRAPITTTCGSGVTAAVLALALERSGAQRVSLYDGSWAEYAQQPEAVIATGS